MDQGQDKLHTTMHIQPMQKAAQLIRLDNIKDKPMNVTAKQILIWSPRVLCIIFAIFLSIFAMDVFSEDYDLGETILALLMHLIPTIMIVFMLVIAWRWEGIGAILFIVLPLLFLIMSRWESWIISGPLLLVGILFLFNWIANNRNNIKANSLGR